MTVFKKIILKLTITNYLPIVNIILMYVDNLRVKKLFNDVWSQLFKEE